MIDPVKGGLAMDAAYGPAHPPTPAEAAAAAAAVRRWCRANNVDPTDLLAMLDVE